MSIANYTEGGKQTETYQQLRCSAHLAEETRKQLIFLSALNIFLSISACVGNSVILAALRKESSLHPPSKLLFSCLATTDLCVGLISEPIAVTRWMSMVKGNSNLCHDAFTSYFIVGYILSSVSLLTLTAISVDRLLALLLRLRYRQVVTLKRTYFMVLTFWVMSTIAATLYLKGHLITYSYGYIMISMCFVTSVSSYAKIFLLLRQHQNQVEDQPNQTNPALNMARYRKAVSSAVWIQLTLIVCYLPYGIAGALLRNGGLSTFEFIAFEYTVT